MMENTRTIGFVLVVMVISLITGLELPNFTDLKQSYPGYKLHGGSKGDDSINKLVSPVKPIEHHTSAIRLSYALNHINDEHAIYANRHVMKKGSVICEEKEKCYIQNPVMFGPYLEIVYKSPEVHKANKHNRKEIVSKLQGRQGIVRLATYQYKRTDARVALWDCDQFYQTRNWMNYRHLIAVEFWQSPDSKCPSEKGNNDTSTIYVNKQRPVRIRHHHKPLRYRHTS